MSVSVFCLSITIMDNSDVVMRASFRGVSHCVDAGSQILFLVMHRRIFDLVLCWGAS